MGARKSPERTPEQLARLQLIEELRLLAVLDAAKTDPKAFIAEINAFDPTTLEKFKFTMFPAEEDYLWPYAQSRANEGWLFQAGIVDWWMGWQNPEQAKLAAWSPNFRFDEETRVFLMLKARQLGITWLAVAVALWYMLFKPGANCVAYSYNEEQSKKLVGRAWLMFNSLPPILRQHVEVISPLRAEEPAEWIKLRHTMPDGTKRISSLQSLPATKKAGHGDTVTWFIMDEVSRQDYARQIFTAILPAVGRGEARGALISTANGVGNADTGEGNYFHILYATHRIRGLGFCFLPWNAEPTRDPDGLLELSPWYITYAMALDEVERNQQYPLNENDAFMLSGELYFDRDALKFYRGGVLPPMFTGQFSSAGNRRANFIKLRDGLIDVWELPVANRKYAISVDASTGRAADFTACHVIDLETGAIVAELHAKIDAPRAAYQLHFLGKWYNTAKIAVERQGGYGEAIITFLRDGMRGVPPYPNMYRHVKYGSGKKPMSEEYGIPMGANRGQLVEGLRASIRERMFPWLSTGTVDELGTFAYADTTPSPRALEGCNDDRVMSLAIANDMFRQFGNPPTKPLKRKAWKKAAYSPPPTRSAA